MTEKLKELIADVSGFEPEDITDGVNFFDEGILDSFGVIHLLVKIEEAFGKQINIAQVAREDIETLEKLQKMVESA